MYKRSQVVQLIAVLGLGLAVAACGGGGGGGSSAPPNHAPVANAGAAQTGAKRATITLDGSASTDADADTLTYAWTQTAGATVTLSSATNSKPTFTAPAHSGDLTFSLIVNDGTANSSAATVTITIENHAPVAQAGAGGMIGASTEFTLDASASSDSDGDPLTYTWIQTQGMTVAIVPNVSGNAVFVAPNAAGTLQFSLTVNDGETDSNVSTETVTVQVVHTVNHPPVAYAGLDQTVPRNSSVLLQGAGSDADLDSVTYKWHQTAGATVALLNDTSPNAQFNAPSTVGDLTFALLVNDGTASSAPSTVTFHVENFAPQIDAITLSNLLPRFNEQIDLNLTTSDPDGDPLTVTYVWKRNGVVVPSATGTTYPLGNQAKGDVISVDVTATDGLLNATANVSATIQDTPTTLSANAPTTAVYGNAISFQVTAADGDGDATGPFEINYGPAGFSVDGAGHVTWTPSGPLFDRDTNMNWSVRLRDAPSVTLDGTIKVTDANRKYPLVRTNAGIPVGNNSIDVNDFDGNGSKEMLVGSYRSLYMLAKNGSDYVQTWVYPFDVYQSAGISAVTSGDPNADGHREIYFASGPVVVALDGVTRREIARFGNTDASSGTPLGPYCTGLKYADIDNDGNGDLVCLGSDDPFGSTSKIYVLDPLTMTVRWQSSPLVLGKSLAVGNVDNDAALEIITSGGFVFDGVTHQNQWAYGPGFGSIVDIGNVNGDGVNKIVGVNSWAAVRVYSATLKSPLWEITTGSNGGGTSAIKIDNLDGVGPAEILVGDAQWGNVTIYHYNSGTNSADTVGFISSIGDGVSAIGVGDVDADGKKEIIWGADFVSSGPDTFAIAAWTPALALKWQGPVGAQLDGPFVGAKSALIATGQTRIMYATAGSNSGYGGTRLMALDPATGLFSISDEVDSNWSHNSAFDVGNVTGGTLDSMLLGTATLYTSYFTAFDFASNTKQWTSATTSGGGVAITHADMNNDGVADLVGITTDGYVYVWDVYHQSLIWSSTGNNIGLDIAVADLNSDGTPEIIALTGSRVVVYAYSSANHIYLESASYSVSAADLLVADTNGDGVMEIFVLEGDVYSGGTQITQLDASLQVVRSFPAANVRGIFLEDSAFSRKNLIASVGSSVYSSDQTAKIAAIDPKSGAVIWESPPILGGVSRNSLEFRDMNADGQLEISFGSGMGMYVTQ